MVKSQTVIDYPLEATVVKGRELTQVVPSNLVLLDSIHSGVLSYSSSQPCSITELEEQYGI
jgi:hypothetical protein